MVTDSLPYAADTDGTQLLNTDPEDWVHTPALQHLLSREGPAASSSLLSGQKPGEPVEGSTAKGMTEEFGLRMHVVFFLSFHPFKFLGMHLNSCKRGCKALVGFQGPWSSGRRTFRSSLKSRWA